MAGVVDELKGKLGKLTGRLEAIRAEAAVLEAQKQAFETVIACYDPFRSSGAPDPKRKTTADLTTATKRVTAPLRNRNPRHIALDILRNPTLPSRRPRWRSGSPTRAAASCIVDANEVLFAGADHPMAKSATADRDASALEGLRQAIERCAVDIFMNKSKGQRRGRGNTARQGLCGHRRDDNGSADIGALVVHV
jgi:hypothetical protein